jgi:hypothetical protein
MMQNNAFLTWAAALLVRFSAKPSPTGGLRLPSGKHVGILTDFQTDDKKKITKNTLFLAGDFYCKSQLDKASKYKGIWVPAYNMQGFGQAARKRTVDS